MNRGNRSTEPMPMSLSMPVVPIPVSLQPLVELNNEYYILIDLNKECRKAVEPQALSEYLSRIYKTKLALCQELDIYIEAFPNLSSNSTSTWG